MAATKSPLIRLLHIRDEMDDIALALQGVSLQRIRATTLYAGRPSELSR
jgi:hypothetical protein